MEYSKLASGSLLVTTTSQAQSVVLPFIPNFIEISNSTRATAASGVTRAWWETDMGAGAAMVVTTGAGPADVTSYITSATGTGFSTFSAGYPQYGAQIQIASISTAAAAVVTTASAHGYSTGDVVILTGLFQSSSTGMPQIAGVPFAITVTGTTTFTIPWNTNQSNYTALSASPSNAFVQKVLYPYIYFPGVSIISAITLGTTTVVATAENHNLVVGSQVAFRIPSAWGTTQLNTPYFGNNLSQPVYGLVTVVTSATQVTVAINSSAFTAFNSNPTVAQALAGLSFPQMVAVGDQNTGALTNTYTPTTINPIAIGGAFQNNSRQGFTIGSAIVGTASDTICWRAYAHDLNS